MDERIQRVMDNLIRNRMKPYFADRRTELYHIIGDLVKKDKLITSGGSMTLKESGVIDFLQNEFGDVYLDRSAGKTPEEVEEILRKAFVSDTFLASSNAITEDGELYNVDGKGNRVSAMIYGPKQVIIVAGVNKIVKDLRQRSVWKSSPRLRTPCALTVRLRARKRASVCTAITLRVYAARL